MSHQAIAQTPREAPAPVIVPQAPPSTVPAAGALVQARTAPLAETRLPLAGLRFVGYSADGKWLRVSNTKGRFQRLATSTLAPLSESEALPPFGTASASITSDKRWSAIGNWRGLTVIFDSQTMEITGEFPADPEVDPTPTTALRIDDQGKLLVTGQRSSIVRLFSVADTRLRWESAKLEQEISGIDLSRDGKYVAVSSGLLNDFNAPGKLVLLDASNGKMLFQHTDMASKVNHVAISPHSKYLLAADNQSLRRYDMRGRLISSAPIGGVQRIKFIDNDLAILSQFPGLLAIWNATQNRLEQIYTGHAKNPNVPEAQLVWALDTAPDGKSFASADSHGNVAVWPIK